MVSKKFKGKSKGGIGSTSDAGTVTSTSVDVAMFDPSIYFTGQKSLFGSFFASPAPAPEKPTLTSVLYSIKNFLATNEDAKVLIFTVMVVLMLFWLVKTMLMLLINLVCPLLVLLIGVLCIPPLRQPVLGQHYPAVADFVRGILLKIADRIN